MQIEQVSINMQGLNTVFNYFLEKLPQLSLNHASTSVSVFQSLLKQESDVVT